MSYEIYKRGWDNGQKAAAQHRYIHKELLCPPDIELQTPEYLTFIKGYNAGYDAYKQKQQLQQRDQQQSPQPSQKVEQLEHDPPITSPSPKLQR